MCRGERPFKDVEIDGFILHKRRYEGKAEIDENLRTREGSIPPKNMRRFPYQFRWYVLLRRWSECRRMPEHHVRCRQIAMDDIRLVQLCELSTDELHELVYIEFQRCSPHTRRLLTYCQTILLETLL